MSSNIHVLERQIRVERTTSSRLREVDFAKVGFSAVFSDHMFTAEYRDGRWKEGVIRPYGPISLSPSISRPARHDSGACRFISRRNA
jgi:branched-chain amino acid aminotransferase